MFVWVVWIGGGEETEQAILNFLGTDDWCSQVPTAEYGKS